MKKLFFLSVILLVVSTTVRSQILDVPYRSDLSGCGVWCWAKSSHMILVYYGNDIYLCDILEYTRQNNPTVYGTEDCCVNPYDSCCHGGPQLDKTYTNSVYDILNNWSLNSTVYTRYLTTSEIQTELSNNRPLAVQQKKISTGGLHVMVLYGYISSNLYIHDPGNGSVILNYTDFTQGLNDRMWQYTLAMNSSATSCPLTQHIIGRIKKSKQYGNIYKAQQDIFASCIIEQTADVEFICGDEIILEAGFRVDLGGSVILNPGSTVICP